MTTRQQTDPTPPTSSSETELDSPLEDMSDYPVSPTDPTMDMGHLQPSDTVLSEGADVSRAPSNSSFFNSVFLDTPDRHLTRPLKVKKRVAPVGPSRIRRRSNHSLPRSPISPLHPTYLHLPASPRQLTRDNSTSSSAHRAITDSFFALDSPTPTFPSPLSPPPTLHTGSRSSSASSAIHLGLGRFAAFDEAAIPGPSPPTSPPTTPSLSHDSPFAGASPTLLTPPPRRVGASKPIPAAPITPTNAPSKAARLLGTNSPLPSALKPSPPHKALADLLRSAGTTAPKRSPHFRPLPNSTLTDIQRFFGDVPRKNLPPVKKGTPRTHGDRAKVTAASTVLRGVDKALPEIKGQGEGHEGAEGRMWLDVEEGQEFAWLMSDLTTNLAPEQRAKVEQAAGVRGEDEWGMEDFKSVLDMKKAQVEKKVKGKSGKEKKERAGPKVFESFLDLGLEEAVEEKTEEVGRSSEEGSRPKAGNRSISNPVLISTSLTPSRAARPARPTATSRSVSAPSKPPTMALPSVPTFPSPPTPASSTSSLSARSRPTPQSSSPLNLSPTRPKHRPPPLDLRYLPPSRGLPIIVTSLSPSLLHPSATLDALFPPLPILTPRTYAHTHSKSVDSPGLPPLLPGRPVPADMPNSATDAVFPSPLFVSYGQKGDWPSKAERLLGMGAGVSVGVGMPPRTPFKHPRRAPVPFGMKVESGVEFEIDGYQRYQKPVDQVGVVGRGEGGDKEEGWGAQVSVFDPPSPTVASSGAKAWFKKRVGRM